MSKRKSVLPFIGVPATKHAAGDCFETGNQDIYWPWWARIHRTIAAFFTEKAKRLHASPEDVRKTPLTVTEQLNLSEQLQRMDVVMGDRRYGSYPHEPVRYRPYFDHLVRRASHEVEDAEFCEPERSSDRSDDDDQPT